MSHAAIPLGLCQCGCGQKTNFPKQNDANAGLRRDVPRRFVVGHNALSKRAPDQSVVIEGRPCVRVALTRGYFATVDLQDYELTSQFKWSAWISYREDGTIRSVYAVRRNGIKLHRFLLGVSQPEILVDHRDGDGLNNRRYNIRICNDQQNVASQRVMPRNTSGFKGVTWDKQTQKWMAQICAKGKRRKLGRFVDIRDAALAYNVAALAEFGEFAKLNLL